MFRMPCRHCGSGNDFTQPDLPARTSLARKRTPAALRQTLNLNSEIRNPNDERMTKPEARTRWDKTLASLPAGKKRACGMAAIRHWDFGLLSSFVIRTSDF